MLNPSFVRVSNEQFSTTFTKCLLSSENSCHANAIVGNEKLEGGVLLQAGLD